MSIARQTVSTTECVVEKGTCPRNTLKEYAKIVFGCIYCCCESATCTDIVFIYLCIRKRLLMKSLATLPHIPAVLINVGRTRIVRA